MENIRKIEPEEMEKVSGAGGINILEQAREITFVWAMNERSALSEDQMVRVILNRLTKTFGPNLLSEEEVRRIVHEAYTL